MQIASLTSGLHYRLAYNPDAALQGVQHQPWQGQNSASDKPVSAFSAILNPYRPSCWLTGRFFSEQVAKR